MTTIQTVIDSQAIIAITFLDGKELTIATLAAVLLIETALVLALLMARRLREPAHAVHELSRRLILAQEEERRRIARELHDHLNQQLALLAIDLQQLAMSTSTSAALTARLDELWQRTNEISSEVHGLSHRLHPSKLEALGLVATIRGHCRDISRQGVVAHFTEDRAPAGIPSDVSLCLFRILEEALSNVVRHSDAREAFVTLEEVDGDVVLRIADDGRGFDTVAPDQAGLGLVSMRERLRSVGGTLSIVSAPGKGALIEARVPRDRAPRMRGDLEAMPASLSAVH
jgi:signal transduction histidine kinase